VGQVTPPAPRLLSIGILEPRKNQTFLLEVVRSLWDDGLKFELHLVGRVNPHFGRAVYRYLRATMKKYADLFYYGAASDEQVRKLYARSRALVFPTVAEGCGLPVLEALWRGLPVVCSDLPVLLENAESGGCLPLPVNDLLAWREGLRSILTDPTRWSELATQARVRTLPTWQECAVTLQRALARR
jgi:glycosyltransferase involved in cell wall biosynthesis